MNNKIKMSTATGMKFLGFILLPSLLFDEFHGLKTQRQRESIEISFHPSVAGQINIIGLGDRLRESST